MDLITLKKANELNEQIKLCTHNIEQLEKLRMDPKTIIKAGFNSDYGTIIHTEPYIVENFFTMSIREYEKLRDKLTAEFKALTPPSNA